MLTLDVSKKIAIIGGGAAGCFCAVEAARLNPQAQVIVYEAGSRPMAKLAVTGGGRCNITNTFGIEALRNMADDNVTRDLSSYRTFGDIGRLEEVYPRGAQLLKRVFKVFGPEDTVAWWEREGVRLVAQDDGCIFPASQDAMQVVRTLERLMREFGVELRCGHRVQRILAPAAGVPSYSPSSSTGETLVIGRDADAVVVTVGGCSSAALRSLLPSEVEVTSTVPSLFTFRLSDAGVHSLMGTVVQDATLSLAGTAFRSRGTLLLTDWGCSGPATLRLSSYAAIHLAEHQYRSTLLINWLSLSEDGARALLQSLEGPRTVGNSRPEGLTDRLWHHILGRAGIDAARRWPELGSKGRNRLVNALVADQYEITGRARFKEEFVTCGGVSLRSVNPSTLEARSCPGLFFAGEALDVDALTGGFNLQAAWSCAIVVARSLALR